MMITKSVVFIAYKITHHDQQFLGKKSSHLHNHEINFWEKLSPDLKIITNMSYNTSINIMTNNIDSSIENLSFSRRPTHVSLARDNFSILQNEKWGCTERTSLVIIQNHYDWIGCHIHVLSRLVIWGIEVWNTTYCWHPAQSFITTSSWNIFMLHMSFKRFWLAGSEINNLLLFFVFIANLG